MANVKLEGIHKAFDETVIIPDLDLEIEDREFVVLVGPSGCGKTTTLRIIAGLEESTKGKVFIGDRDVTSVKPGLRHCAMVFQNYALYPHMTVRENITYGMKVRRIDRQKRDAEADKAAEILGIAELMERKPKNLSGGQRQRVAIGRAIVRDPQVFLFDEPLSNLDAKLRISMRGEIKSLHRRLQNTTIYVTHDQVEAMTLADRVVVMNEGIIVQIGEPLELYEKPADRFVAGFIGSPSMNFFEVKVVEKEGRTVLQFQNGDTLPVAEKYLARCSSLLGRDCTFGIRPEHFAGGNCGPATIDILVKVIEPIGQFTLVVSDFAKEKMTIQVEPHYKLDVAELATVTVDMEQMHLFDSKTGKSLLLG